MTATLALLPPAVVLVAILVLRVSGLVAALLAALATAGLWVAGIFASPTMTQAGHAAADAALLTSVVAAMVVPGILFVEAARRQAAPAAIQGLVHALRLPVPQAAILIAVGIGVLVESLTGMGVSLLVTVPLLFSIVERRAAIGLALVGMSLMPWGALSISGLVGAKLAGLPIDQFSDWVLRVSGPVAVSLPVLCLAFLPARRPADVVVALAAGVAMIGAIALTTRFVGIELAGVAAGLAVITLLAMVAERQGIGDALRAPGLRPYAALIAAVLIQKLLVVLLARAGVAPVLSTGRTQFAFLSSPGVALIMATLVASARAVTASVLVDVARRAWRPVAAVALFMLSARLMVECGAVAALSQLVGGFGPAAAIVGVAVLGAVSGFVTGSGVTGNALFMPSAAAVGASFDQLPLFAALQNGAAGHVAMASLPVAAILLASLPARGSDDDRAILSTGLALAAVHVAVLIIAALVWYHAS